VDAVVANWGGFTHTSVAIHDALELLDIPKVEVHLSNIHARRSSGEDRLPEKRWMELLQGLARTVMLLGVEAAIKLLNRK
jgi:3-dehydroquinate dehydratase II